MIPFFDEHKPKEIEEGIRKLFVVLLKIGFSVLLVLLCFLFLL